MKCENMAKAQRIVNGNRIRFDHPCGTCLSCRMTKRQEWTFRIMLEMRQHKENWFVTLTYDNDNLPENGVEKAEIQGFMKRLRARAEGKIRFFAVGEYGERYKRPHYHLVLFSDGGIQTKLGIDPRTKEKGVVDSDIHAAWNKRGFVDVRPVLANDDGLRISSYVASYVVKKLTTPERMEEMGDSRNPEFSLMSRRPGIGLQGLGDLAKALRHHEVGPKFIDGTKVGNDLWMVRFNGRMWPVNRVLREKLYAELGVDLRTEMSTALSQDQKALLAMLDPEAEDDVEERKARAKAMWKKKRMRNVH